MQMVRKMIRDKFQNLPYHLETITAVKYRTSSDDSIIREALAQEGYKIDGEYVEDCVLKWGFIGNAEYMKDVTIVYTTLNSILPDGEHEIEGVETIKDAVLKVRDSILLYPNPMEGSHTVYLFKLSDVVIPMSTSHVYLYLESLHHHLRKRIWQDDDGKFICDSSVLANLANSHED